MLSEKEPAAFKQHLQEEEKSPFTIEKYLRDAQAFVQFCDDRELSKELVVSYKQKRTDSGSYAVGSINTTRIYIMASCREHQQKIDKMDLVTG